jgi:hypothetical protein
VPASLHSKLHKKQGNVTLFVAAQDVMLFDGLGLEPVLSLTGLLYCDIKIC